MWWRSGPCYQRCAVSIPKKRHKCEVTYPKGKSQLGGLQVRRVLWVMSLENMTIEPMSQRTMSWLIGSKAHHHTGAPGVCTITTTTCHLTFNIHQHLNPAITLWSSTASLIGLHTAPVHSTPQCQGITTPMCMLLGSTLQNWIFPLLALQAQSWGPLPWCNSVSRLPLEFLVQANTNRSS
jgi:hypothetical protein